MKIKLSVQEKQALEKRHRKERDGRVRDRIKAVLLKSEGWINEAIAQALRIHVDTVSAHLQEWVEEQKLKPENGGSSSKLDPVQTKRLSQHLQDNLYTRVADICAYVLKSTQRRYTVSGMTKWLHEKGFCYKQPKATPAKANTEQQQAFIEHYRLLKAQACVGEPIIFMDAVHPTMATKISHGWIKKGQDKQIAQTASRTRVNIIGAIELATLNVVSSSVEIVNSQTIEAFFEQLSVAYLGAQKLNIILDQSGYHRSQRVRDAALRYNIKLHYLPPYSPNLNPIERLWKFMNEQVRNNIFFKSAKHFREEIASFFSEKLPALKVSLASRINDNFQPISTVSSG
jgi:transposase